MIRTLIFDWDGTIHNTAPLYGGAFRAVYAGLVREGLMPERYCSDEEMAAYLGLTGPEMWERFAPQLPLAVRERSSVQVGQELARRVAAGEAVLYPGAEDTLARLKKMGYYMVVLSNCRRSYMKAQREHFRLERFFDGFYAAEDYDFQPKEKIFVHIAAQYPGEYAMIGDRLSDMRVGREPGVHNIFCRYGFGKPEEGEGAVVLDDIGLLPSVLWAMETD